MAIETGFSRISTYKKAREEGEGTNSREAYNFIEGGCVFGGGRLLERGRLFEEIRYAEFNKNSVIALRLF